LRGRKRAEKKPPVRGANRGLLLPTSPAFLAVPSSKGFIHDRCIVQRGVPVARHAALTRGFYRG